MGQIETLDAPSLDRFRLGLISRGYEPIAGTDGREWTGPVPGSLLELTSSTTARIVIRDGFPYQWPQIFVDGMSVEHVNGLGEVCLWQPDDEGLEWSDVDDFFAKFDAWGRQAREGFDAADRFLDAHLYFERRVSRLAVMDVSDLFSDSTADGSIADRFRALSSGNDGAYLISKAARPTYVETLQVVGYFRSSVILPPRRFAEFCSLLTSDQFADLVRRLRERQPLIALLAWRADGRTNVLALLCRWDPVARRVQASAIEIAPRGTGDLLLRAGPDSEVLRHVAVCVLGVGGVGSQVATLLAQSGVGTLTLVDGERLRPGNVVRHAGHSWEAGVFKVEVTEREVRSRAPWTRVRTVAAGIWAPNTLGELAKRHTLIVDAVGSATFTKQLSMLSERGGWPLICAALYRNGTIGRVQRQLDSTDVAIYRRVLGGSGFPLIEPSDDDERALELGCSSAVLRASPTAVTSVAVLTAQLAVDGLTGRRDYSSEVIDVSAPSDAPFDKVGRFAYG